MPASRSNRRDLLIWAACATPALLLLVHAMGIVALGWETRSLGSFAPLEGPAYQAPLGSRWMSQELTGDSPARVLEDGRPLAHANAEIDQIVKKGGGRYALRFGALYFSTSDGSDPRTNGRRYELAWPVQPPLALGGGLLLLGLAATMVLLARHRSEIAAAVRQPAYWWSAAVYLAIAGLGRLWFFLEFRVPGLYGDSTSYYAIVQAMDHGHWPEFGIRTPGYPLLLKLIFALSNTVMAVIVVQNLLAIAAALTMIYAFHVYRRSLSLWAAIGMGVYTIGLWTFDSDTALLSDGPYANAIVLALALLMLGVLRRRPSDLA